MNERTETHARDLVSRQAAIEVMCSACWDWCDEGVCKRVSAIQEIPSAQPDLSTYSDKLWRAAYERGKREAETERKVRQLILDAPTIEPGPQWIPVSERFPGKHGEMYLVTISDGSVYSCALQWDVNQKRWYLSFLNNGKILVDYIDNVIAWMPLPEPYEEGLKDGKA